MEMAELASNKALVGNYLPCCYCFGMFSKKILWKHQSLCKSKKNHVWQTAQKPDEEESSYAARLLPLSFI